MPLVDADIGLNQQTKLRTSPGRVLPNEQDQQQNGKHTGYRRHVGGGHEFHPMQRLLHTGWLQSIYRQPRCAGLQRCLDGAPWFARCTLSSL